MRWCLVVLTMLGVPAQSQVLTSSAGDISLTRTASGLEEPWGIDFLPDGRWLITERAGRLRLFALDGTDREVSGLPDVRETGQGGLLDVAVARDFTETREIFLSFAKPQGRGEGTALAVARLDDVAARLEDLRIIFEMSSRSTGGRHFGSRIVEGTDGTLYLTIGDRGDPELAQDRSVHNGSLVRVARDGSIPEDNPFVGTEGMLPEIWSFGHRNPQGAALDAQGRLWINEHGARGGDEVNMIRRGANYGWPVISYGRHYSGAKIGEGTRKAGMEQPVHYWDPSIAPSGMIVYSGRLWPEWEGDLFVGSLKFGLISRLENNDGSVIEAERIEGAETARVRDVAEAPDGSIWFLSVGQGAAYRMTPAE